MASSLIGAIRVALGLDTAQFEAGAEKARQIAKSKSADMANSFNSAKRAVEGLLAAFTVAAIADQIKKSLEYAGSIAEVAKQLGVTTTQLQTYRYAAGQTGVAQDQLEVGLRRLTVSIGKAELGSKDQTKAFQALGISVDQLKGKNTGQVFELMANSLSKVTDRSQRAAVEMQLMGRTGSNLDNLLAPGAKRLNELAEAAQRLGIVLSDEQIQSAEETAHKLEAVKEVLSAQIAGVVANNANAILSLSSALASLTGAIIKFLGSNPQLALSIIGALLGVRVGGLPGAVLGGAAGLALGSHLQQNLDDTNTDPAFRKQQLIAARNALITARSSASSEPFMAVNGMVVSGGGSSSRAAKIASAQAEFDKQVKLANEAAAQMNARAASLRNPPPGVDLPKFLSPSGGRKRTPKDLNEDVSFQFAQQERQIDMSILQARRQLEGTAEQRATIDLQMIQLEHDMQDAEIKHKVAQAQKDYAQGKITKATLDEVVTQSAILKAKNDELTQDKLKALAEEQSRRKAEAIFQIDEQNLQFKTESLRTADQLARTAADHKRIQLQILDAEIAQKKLELEHEKQLAIRNGATKEEIDAIQAKIDHLPTERAEGAAQINQNNKNPLQQYFDDVPRTTQELIESLEKIGAEHLDKFNDGLIDVLNNSKSLKEAWHNLGALVHSVALDWLKDLEKLALKMAERSLFMAIFGGFSSGGFVGSGFASGGFVSGAGGPTSDSIPAMLSNGEFVVNAKATKHFRPFLEKLNTGSSSLASGGLAIPRANYGERGGISNDNEAGMTPPIQIVTNIDATGADPAQLARVRASVEQLHAELPRKILTTVADAKQRFVLR